MSRNMINEIRRAPRIPRDHRNTYGLRPPKFDWPTEIAAWLFIGGLIWVLWHVG